MLNKWNWKQRGENYTVVQEQTVQTTNDSGMNEEHKDTM